MRIPRKLHVHRQQRSKKDKHSHGESAMQLQHPELAGAGNEIVTVRGEVTQPGPDRASCESGRERSVKRDFVAAAKPDGIATHAK